MISMQNPAWSVVKWVLVKAFTSFFCVPQDEEDEDRVMSLFDKARRAGAVQGTSADLEPPSSSFRGQGRTLTGGPQVRLS